MADSPTAVVTFQRIGRHHDVPNLSVRSHDLDKIAERVFHYSKKYLLSRVVNVEVDEDGTGVIWCGMQSGGTFTVEYL
jgi:hypothetical protein